eukprot:c8622_g1_i1.p1 GENE.c8622_g1_i1~~c8622_g1_i1.p1  ORF type:complete len:240 (+),score=63.34 c8622_g1_i1:68-721(+)
MAAPIDFNVSEGWMGRIVNGCLIFGSMGGAFGAVRGLWTGHGAIRLGAGMALNGMEVAACYWGLKELIMTVRKRDDWHNHALGGFASGALMSTLYYGRTHTAGGSIVAAVVATSCYFANESWIDYKVALYLENQLQLKQQQQQQQEKQQQQEIEATKKAQVQPELPEVASSWKLPAWFPVKVLTDQQYEEISIRQQQQKQIQRNLKQIARSNENNNL